MERLSKQKVCYGYLPDIPKINLSGKYLLKFGFEIGDQIHVKVSREKIEIVKAEVEETELIVMEPSEIK